MQAPGVKETPAQAAELAARFPAITACRLDIQPMPSGEVEARVEILLPQHQIILNETAANAESARRKALASAAARLDELARRDPRILTR